MFSWFDNFRGVNTMNTIYKHIDLSKIFNYTDFPDKHAGRCDNCNQSHFKSTVKEGKFVRECRNCGMKKQI